MSNSIDYTKKCLALITGASKGIGRQIAIELSKRFKSNSTLILFARSQTGLKETESLILKENANVSIKTYPLDLSKPDLAGYETLIQECITDVDFAIIYHNVGSLGTLDKLLTVTEVQKWRDFFDLNLFGPALLNSVFIKKMRPHSQKLYVVNISSLCGSQPFESMGMYGTGKAARNLYFKVLAAEENDLIVLNYSPGPVDTDMVAEVIDNTTSEDIKSMFVGLKKEKTILTADVTINKLLDVLGSGEFKSGDLIDYYDRI